MALTAEEALPPVTLKSALGLNIYPTKALTG